MHRSVARLLALSAPTSPRAQSPRAGTTQSADRIVALDPRWTVVVRHRARRARRLRSGAGLRPAEGRRAQSRSISNSGVVKWKVPLADGVDAGNRRRSRLRRRRRRRSPRSNSARGTRIGATPLDSPLAAPLYWDTGWLLASTEAGDLVALHAQDGRSPLAQRARLAAGRRADARRRSPLRRARATAASSRSTLATRRSGVDLAAQRTGHRMLALERPAAGRHARRIVLHSLSLDRGRVRWSQRAGADIAGAPVADDDLIYFAAFDNVLRALDRSSGNLRWSAQAAVAARRRPAPRRQRRARAARDDRHRRVHRDHGRRLFTIRAVGELGGVPFLRESARGRRRRS